MSVSKEDEFVRSLLRGLPPDGRIPVGPGDDCAVVVHEGVRILLKTDCVVEGVHFEAGTDPARVGRKALARVLSDIAAMAGEPGPALVTAGSSDLMDGDWLRRAYRGMAALAGEFGVGFAGGETTRTPGAGFLSVAMTGDVVRPPVLRSGGRSGDSLYVTGTLGGSLGSGWHLDFRPRVDEARWLAESFRITAMMDLSDGLAADLPRLARASGTGFQIGNACLPRRAGATLRQALTDGEDYELLFALGAEDSERVPTAWRKRFPDVPLSRIGRLEDGAWQELGDGFDHFADTDA